MNERKLTKSELAKREDIIMKMKKNKRALTQKYGKDAEAVMYGRATKLAKKQAEAMDQDKIKELVKDALQNPKKADLNKDGKLSDYEKKRGAAIEKAMEKVDEMDINDPIAMRLRADKDKLAKMRAANAGDDGNDKFFDAAKLRALKKKRAEIMRDMEQEAEMEGGPIADKYGDMLNKINAAIAKLGGHGEWGPERDTDISGEEIAKRAAMMGLEEGFYGPSQISKIVGNIGYDSLDEFFEDNPGAIEAVLEFIDQYFPDAMDDELSSVYEDLDLGHEDNEPHMLKADLYRIGKYAMELYQMVDRFEESSEEVDFPHWWQSKVIKAKDMLVSAKHYLDFEIKEPQIDAMVDVAQDVEAIDEGTWTIGPIKDISTVLDALDQMMDFKNPKDIVRYLSKLDRFLYNTIGDDIFHDDIDGAKREASEGNMDRAMNRLSDAYSRAEYFLERQMDREGLKEEEAGEADMVASDIQKAMNKHKGDDAKMHQLQLARKAMNKGDLDKAKKIVSRYLEEGLPKGYWDKKMDAKDEVSELLDDTPSAVVAKANNKIVNVATMAKSLLDIYDDFKAKEKIDFEANSNFVQALKFLTKAAQPQIDKETKGVDVQTEDYDALVNKIKKQGKSEKAAKAIAGAVASYKAKGGGKGPTAKQKARG